MEKLKLNGIFKMPKCLTVIHLSISDFFFNYYYMCVYLFLIIPRAFGCLMWSMLRLQQSLVLCVIYLSRSRSLRTIIWFILNGYKLEFGASERLQNMGERVGNEILGWAFFSEMCKICIVWDFFFFVRMLKQCQQIIFRRLNQGSYRYAGRGTQEINEAPLQLLL